jgi:hypothetical protein
MGWDIVLIYWRNSGADLNSVSQQRQSKTKSMWLTIKWSKEISLAPIIFRCAHEMRRLVENSLVVRKGRLGDNCD